MSRIGEKVAYLKGLAEGMGVSADNEQGRLTLAIIDVLEAFAAESEAHAESIAEIEQYVEEIDDDVSSLEEALFSEDDDDDDEYDDDDEDGDDGLIEYECPHCGTVVFFDEEAFDMEEEHVCPNCHRKIFSEDEDPDEE